MFIFLTIKVLVLLIKTILKFFWGLKAIVRFQRPIPEELPVTTATFPC